MDTVRFVVLPLVLVAVWGMQVCCVWGLRLELNRASGKCVSEDIQNDVIVVGSYHVVSENVLQGTLPVKIKAQILSPHSERLHFGDNVEGGHFGFHTKVSGIHSICFWLDSEPNYVVSIDLDLKMGMAAKDWSSIAKKEKIEGMELELRRLEDAVDYIHREMLRLRESESEMRNVSEATNARVAWFSIASLFICLIVAGWQLWHLKSFFERKKLL